jgi:hypothetical protein
MAVIQHVNPDVHAIGHGGVEYVSKGESLFDVPHDVAVELVKNAPHQIRMYDGLPWPHPKTPEQLEAERLAGAIKQVLAEQPEPAKKKRGRR